MNSLNIPTYTASEDPEKWLEIYNDAAIRNKWRSGEKKMAEIPNNVDTDVQQWMTSQDFDEWDTLKKEFVAHYKKIYSAKQTVERLKYAYQRSTESLESYTETFERRRKRHVKETTRNLDCTKLTEKQLIKYYINGLKSQSQRHLIRKQNPKTVKDAQSLAEEYDEEQDSSTESSDSDTSSVEVHNPNEIRIRISNSKPKEFDRPQINGITRDRYHKHGTDARFDRYERVDVMLLQRPSQRGRSSSAPGTVPSTPDQPSEDKMEITPPMSPPDESVRNYSVGDDNEYMWLQRKQNGLRFNMTSKFLNVNANFRIDRYNLLPAARTSAPALTNE
ncbi:hypothetical protein INT43_001901 [Umbelopsis isabellina]|uniref:Ty3 transposon capsid-like protein domain-containing protein n=1 Tax=Mortierella isabellina TaxID=91625 RepID=A0A8H7PRQ3_MORIS|nr:hypothetical protein INT43_001901 [Umbelopsis isabellina]